VRMMEDEKVDGNRAYNFEGSLICALDFNMFKGGRVYMHGGGHVTFPLQISLRDPSRSSARLGLEKTFLEGGGGDAGARNIPKNVFLGPLPSPPTHQGRVDLEEAPVCVCCR
jgi:hypothetical protein